MNRRFTLAALTTILSLVFFTCTSSTVIRSNVPGAKVYLNGAYVGNTPYTMSDTKIVGSTTQVRIEGDGYTPVHAIISRNESFSVGACIGGVFLLVPFLWIMEYNPEHFYQLAVGSGYAPSAPAGQGYPRPAPPAPTSYPGQPAPYPAPR